MGYGLGCETMKIADVEVPIELDSGILSEIALEVYWITIGEAT